MASVGPYAKSSDKVFAWFSVWNEVNSISYRIIDCLHMVRPMLLPPQNTIISCLIKIHTVFAFLVVLEKKLLN